MKLRQFLIPLIWISFWAESTWAHKTDYHLGFRIAPRVSTLGGGLEFAKGLTPWLGLRGGVNYFTWNYETTDDGNDYDVNLELKSVGLFADLHPFKQAFRISLGVLLNGNGLDGTAQLGPGETFELDGNEYSLLNNSASMELSYNTFAPYAGIGWDTTFGDDDRWGFAFDIGVVYSGAPDLALDAKVNSTNPLVIDQFEKDKKSEVSDTQSDLDEFKFWPVVSAGLVYQF